MSQVNFSKKIEAILESLDYSKLGQKVAIKVHFGEKGCNTYLDPKIVKKVYKKIQSLGKKPNPIFINVLKNITPVCDCFGGKQTPIMADIGFLSSINISAIDQASLDLANKFSKHKFDKINDVNKANQIRFAQKLKLGDNKYDLINV